MVKELSFRKMDGLGNDFIIFDARKEDISLSVQQITELSDRNNGVTKGCDQLGIIYSSDNADCFLRIYNADGSEVDTCGNILRCVAKIIMKESQKGTASIDTKSGVRYAALIGASKVKVDMGEPKFAWKDIPLTYETDTLRVPIGCGNLQQPAVVNVGNPHAVFFVDDIKPIDFSGIGSFLENHEIFPQRANIGAAQIVGQDLIRLRVFERGVGETKACGSGACAAVVLAHKKGLCAREVTVVQEGGELELEWLENNQVMMTGPVNFQFEGNIVI